MGNNRVVSNIGRGAEDSNEYYPFGGLIAEVSTNRDKQDFKYNGKEYDSMHGLNQYDYAARYYDPANIRFTTMDPHSENYYSWSPYAYVGNNPLRIIDPNGKDWRDVVAGYAIGFATNVIPLSSSIRDSYSPTSSSDYNRVLQGVDNASIVLGGLMISGGATTASGGTATVTAGAVVAVTGIGAPEGAAIAIGGGALITSGEASIAGGVYLMANTANNKSQGYDRGKKDGDNSKGGDKNSPHANQKAKDSALERYNMAKSQLDEMNKTPNKTPDLKKNKRN